jgi:hypothetical protein
VIPDSLEAPDGLGEFSTESTVFVFVMQPSDFKCSQPCGPCDVRSIVDTQWTADGGAKAFNPSAFLGRINKVVTGVEHKQSCASCHRCVHVQFIALPQLDAASLDHIKLLRQTNVVCGANQAAIVLTEITSALACTCGLTIVCILQPSRGCALQRCCYPSFSWCFHQLRSQLFLGICCNRLTFAIPRT